MRSTKFTTRAAAVLALLSVPASLKDNFVLSDIQPNEIPLRDSTVTFLPTGHNVFKVLETDRSILWRGGAPSKETILELAEFSKKYNRSVTLIDLRKPERAYDLSGDNGGLTSVEEKNLSERNGLNYLRISALDPSFCEVVIDKLKAGDVYLHCMYGVNRTGFAIGRLSIDQGAEFDIEGLGKRDVRSGENFEETYKN